MSCTYHWDCIKGVTTITNRPMMTNRRIASLSAAREKLRNDAVVRDEAVAAARDKATAGAREHASALNSTKKSKPTLTTLPAEIRNIIYTYALCRTKKITISKDPQKQPRGKCQKGLHGNLKVKTSQQISPNLLRTCKLVHREARPILYGDNHFIIPSLYIKEFLSIIGFSAQHLADITFELNCLTVWEAHSKEERDRSTDTWREAFFQLGRLVGLQKLKLRMYVAAEWLDAAHIVRKLLPIAATMKRARCEVGKAWTKESLLEALTISVEIRGGRGGGLLQAEREAALRDFRRDVAVELEKQIVDVQ